MHINLAEKPYSLSIRIYPDGFSLFVCNENNEVLSTEHHYTEGGQLEESFISLCSTLSDCQSVSLVMVTDFYTLIPATIFNPDKKNDFLRLQHPNLTDTSEIFYTYYKHIDAILVYAFDKKNIKTVQSAFPEINIQHHLHHLIENLETARGEQISLIIKSGSIDCLASRHNYIQLLNNFAFQTEEDIVYHVLNILHHLDFNHETTQITIYHENNKSINPIDKLKPYISKIHLKDIPINL